MSLVLDLIIVAILAICVIAAAKKGFMRTLVELVGFVAAIVIAFAFSGPLAEFTYSKLIEPAASSTVEAAVSGVVGETAESASQTLGELFESLPNFVTNFAEQSGYSADSIAQKVSSGADVQAISAELCDKIVDPAITAIIKYILVLVLFVITLIVAKLLSRFINSLFKGALLGTANTVLGGVLGAVKGAIFALIFCLVVSLIANFSSADTLSDAISCSYIIKAVLDSIPFAI